MEGLDDNILLRSNQSIKTVSEILKELRNREAPSVASSYQRRDYYSILTLKDKERHLSMKSAVSPPSIQLLLSTASSNYCFSFSKLQSSSSLHKINSKKYCMMDFTVDQNPHGLTWETVQHVCDKL